MRERLCLRAAYIAQQCTCCTSGNRQVDQAEARQRIYGKMSVQDITCAVGFKVPVGQRGKGNAIVAAHAQAFRAEQLCRFDTMQFRFRSEEHTSELQSLMRNSYAV